MSDWSERPAIYPSEWSEENDLVVDAPTDLVEPLVDRPGDRASVDCWSADHSRLGWHGFRKAVLGVDKK